MEAKCLLFYVSVQAIYSVLQASHFKGGTISWKPTGYGHEVRFSFKLGWSYGQGPGCNHSRVGQLVTGMNTSYWQCTSGCNGTVYLANVNYICTGASVTEDWEQGENTFTYIFPGIGPYTVEFSIDDWNRLNLSSSGNWSLGTVVYLANRSDTHLLNRSPVTTGKPVYIVQYGCQATIRIPAVDDDGDTIRCRWSEGSNFTIFKALPSLTMDNDACTVLFPANHTPNGIYAVRVSVEDFPKSTISIGSRVYTPSNILSTVNLQFLVNVTTASVPGHCSDRPRFITPSPVQGSTRQTNILRKVQLSFYIRDTRGITKVDITAPAGMTYTSPQAVPSQPGSVFVTTTWSPQQSQVGTHIVCAVAENSLGKTSESRCINIYVNDVSPCFSEPCQGNGTCVRNKTTQNYTCKCDSGFTGTRCETEINECSSDPCNFLFYCEDRINGYQCRLIEWKLVLIIVSSLMLVLLIYFAVSFFF